MKDSSVPGYSLGPSLPANVLAEYRLSRRYGRPALIRIALLGLVALIAGLPFALGRGTGPIGLVLFVGCGVIVLYNAGATLWRARFCTRVRRDGIEIHGYFNHFVRWQDVQGVLSSGYGGARAINDAIEGMVTASGRRYYPRRYGSSMGRRARIATVRLVRADGHPMLLRAPLVAAWAPDPEFDNKTRQLQGFCQQYASGRRIGAAGVG